MILTCVPSSALQSALCMTWLGDSVFSIRAAAVANLARLSKIFGVEWACEHIVPKIIALYSHSNYLFRMTSLACIRALADQVGQEVLRESMLPLVLQAARDPVPNIRFNVAKILAEIVSMLDVADVQQHIKPTLSSMTQDSDM